MASRNTLVGTGVALAGISGIAIAAVTANPQVEKADVRTVAQPVETRTVVIRKVEHRVKRVKPKHPRQAAAAAPAPAPAPVPVVQQSAPVVVQPTPVAQQTPVRNTAPVRTRTSGSSGRSGDDAGEHELESHESDDSGELGDD